MKLLALVVFIVALTAFAQPPDCGNVQECTALHPPWGEGGIALSYDIVNERVMLPVVKFSYDAQQVASFQGFSYKIPDQLFFNEVNRFVTDKSYKMSNSTEQFFTQNIKSTSLGLSLEYAGVTLGGAFSHTKDQIKELTKNDQRSLAVANVEILGFTMSMAPLEEDEYHPALTRSISRLPQNCAVAADDHKYDQFIQWWGTHFFVDATYGGKQNISTSLDADFVHSRDSTYVTQQISASIGYAMVAASINTSAFSNTTSVTDEFREASTTNTLVLGGDPTVFALKGYPDWLQTLPPHPEIGVPARYAMIAYRSRLAPLSMLLTDPVQRACLDKAVLRYAA